jgi:hypothetical protein
MTLHTFNTRLKPLCDVFTGNSLACALFNKSTALMIITI